MKAIKQTLLYFQYFEYPPTEKELYLFLPQKISYNTFISKLTSMLKSKQITHSKGRYTLGGHGMLFTIFKKKKLLAGKKWLKARKITSVLNILPYMEYIGVSGSLSMDNTHKGDDIDLFIVTSKNRLFTGRFMTSLIIDLLGMRRKRSSKQVEDRICLNLFFDGINLKVPAKKRNIYVAHELLQLKTLYDKKNIHQQIIAQNKWIYTFLPNAQEMYSSDVVTKRKKWQIQMSSGFSLLEVILRKIQLYIINKHKTREIITRTQLWFYPEDVEEKLKRDNIISKPRKE